ncbi:glycosyltransferase family 9 protein [Aquabacterium sp. A7-Y]|uniref:glycosyltransferase family 9 protein n=1 Tax=Aquabacterium sp. A7-Y TaxID=1349605 RepID=UPI00223E1DA7|nr:glycosyltransferase family 9 protein [Aquabacterium sp. A7-Y]MCW7536290.1 glycosyltransferase family 9 protein [Aquabacterium sp. A7-Y]
MDTRPKTAVLHQFTGIGDLVWHIPYFEAVARQSRDGQVAVIAQPSTLARDLLAHEPWLTEVIDHDHRRRRSEGRASAHGGLTGMWRMAKQLRELKFDRLVLFSGRPSRGLLAALSGIPRRSGYGYHWLQRIFLTEPPFIPRYRGPAVAVYKEATAFAIAQGFCEDAIVPRIRVPAELVAEMSERLSHLPRPLYAFAIGTSEPHKQWGLDKFAALARRLLRTGCGVVLLGGPGERQLAEQIEAAAGQERPRAIMSLTQVPLVHTAAALHSVNACVGNDTGAISIAAASGCRTFVLLGNRPALDHDPLIQGLCADRLEDIAVDDVWRALRG